MTKRNLESRIEALEEGSDERSELAAFLEALDPPRPPQPANTGSPQQPWSGANDPERAPSPTQSERGRSEAELPAQPNETFEPKPRPGRVYRPAKNWRLL